MPRDSSLGLVNLNCDALRAAASVQRVSLFGGADNCCLGLIRVGGAVRHHAFNAGSLISCKQKIEQHIKGCAAEAPNGHEAKAGPSKPDGDRGSHQPEYMTVLEDAREAAVRQGQSTL